MDRHRIFFFGTIAAAAIIVAGTFALVQKVRSIASEEGVTARLVQENETLAAGNLKLGDIAPDFTLPDIGGEPFTLSSLLDGNRFVVINFHHPDCPCAANCGKMINEMTAEGYDDVAVVGVMSHGTTDTRAIAALIGQHAEGIINFPVYLDHEKTVQTAYGATRTPEIWLLDKTGRIAFYGAPESTLFPGSPGHRYLLKEAIDALRAGRQPEFRRREPIGCRIGE